MAFDAPDDLLYALRGAGHSQFGIVTELQFRTQPAERLSIVFKRVNRSRAAHVIGRWQRSIVNLPHDMESGIVVRNRKTASILFGLHGGTAKELRQRVADLFGDTYEFAQEELQVMVDSLHMIEATANIYGFSNWRELGLSPKVPPKARLKQQTAFTRAPIDHNQLEELLAALYSDDHPAGIYLLKYFFFVFQERKPTVHTHSFFPNYKRKQKKVPQPDTTKSLKAMKRCIERRTRNTMIFEWLFGGFLP